MTLGVLIGEMRGRGPGLHEAGRVHRDHRGGAERDEAVSLVRVAGGHATNLRRRSGLESRVIQPFTAVDVQRSAADAAFVCGLCVSLLLGIAQEGVETRKPPLPRILKRAPTADADGAEDAASAVLRQHQSKAAKYRLRNKWGQTLLPWFFRKQRSIF